MYMSLSSFSTSGENLTFIGNTAEGMGPSKFCGVLCIYATLLDESNSRISATLLNNAGTTGGALYIDKIYGNVTLTDIYAENNIGGALGIVSSAQVEFGNSQFLNNHNPLTGAVTITDSDVSFDGSNTFDSNYGSAIAISNSSMSFAGNTRILSNDGKLGGGGIKSSISVVKFSGNTLFYSNIGHQDGGAMLVEGGILELSNNETKINFSSNEADRFGGGLFASSNTKISVAEGAVLNFIHNSARCGGAMYFMFTTLTMKWYAKLITFNNSATEFGGAILYEDVVDIAQCRNVTERVPFAFLQIDRETRNDVFCPVIQSYNNSAGKDGNFLYGGLLDRSRFHVTVSISPLPYDYFTSVCRFNMSPAVNKLNNIASEPYQLSPCGGDELTFRHGITLYRGQTFRLHILALGQGNSKVPTVVTALVSPNARLNLNQSSQFIDRYCSTLSYNFYSTQNTGNLTLNPDDGQCQKAFNEAKTTLHVKFRCPKAFTQFKEKCVCEKRLQQYNATCTIDDYVSIWRYEGAKFWMNALYFENGSYGGLILYSTCPSEYCTDKRVNISLDNPDVQCAPNRGGILCGKCIGTYSLLLGGSRCGTCSNSYLLLILPFALAGIVLIAFLTFLKLTVAAGTVNSLILYANIMQVNRNIFFPSPQTNVLTVFIAWVNLDLGFETCFFDGMDVYHHTWLQFSFFVYVWILISLIILVSRYSVTASKLLGSNPIAVLATLLLMSYNKILKVIIDVFSSVTLDYPQGRQVTVWFKDGNLAYLRSKHLVLSIFTIFVVLFLFFPYTIFLLLGHVFYRLPYRNFYFWLLIKFKPLLDSYYAPFKDKTRFWTGFLLLVRCALYIVFSFNSLWWD